MAALPFNTNDGGAWLKKALDPAELGVDVIGMPDANTNSRTVINYQMQADVLVPDSDTYNPTTNSSYDANLYVYQDPIIFGMSASFPSGTADPQNAPIIFDFVNGKITLGAGTAPRTVQVYLNSQIGGTSYPEKRASLKEYCQKFRMIYGGVQAIPACSEMFDSGTIEATQQILNPEIIPSTEIGYAKTNTSVGDGGFNPQIPTGVDTSNNAFCEYYRCGIPSYSSVGFVNNGTVINKVIFQDNDFPDNGVGIQNPTSLYCRYKQGVYMPYKLRNPLNHVYKNAEQNMLYQTPYIISNQVYCKYLPSQHSGNYPYVCCPMEYDPNTRTFSRTVAEAFSNGMIEFYIKCYTKTGIPFWIVAGETSVGSNHYDSKTIDLKSLNICPFSNTHNPLMTEIQPANATTDNDERTFVLCTANASITNATEIPREPIKIVSPLDQNIGVICFKSIAVQASIRLIFRLGFELMIVAGGVYSPFKRAPPRYDPKALNSYVSAIHHMRDAFYGDAATSGGHGEYTKNLVDLVTGNLGTGWYGTVAV